MIFSAKHCTYLLLGQDRIDRDCQGAGAVDADLDVPTGERCRRGSQERAVPGDRLGLVAQHAQRALQASPGARASGAAKRVNYVPKHRMRRLSRHRTSAGLHVHDSRQRPVRRAQASGCQRKEVACGHEVRPVVAGQDTERDGAVPAVCKR